MAVYLIFGSTVLPLPSDMVSVLLCDLAVAVVGSDIIAFRADRFLASSENDLIADRHIKDVTYRHIKFSAYAACRSVVHAAHINIGVAVIDYCCGIGLAVHSRKLALRLDKKSYGYFLFPENTDVFREVGNSSACCKIITENMDGDRKCAVRPAFRIFEKLLYCCSVEHIDKEI